MSVKISAQNFKKYVSNHKAKSLVLIIIIVGLGYWTYTKLHPATSTNKYITTTVQKGTITTSVTGSGQVSVSNQIDLKPKASGNVTYIGVTDGQNVKADTLIAQLDTRDAQKAVRDAMASLDSAKLSLEKIQQPADNLSLIQAQNSLVTAQSAKESAQNDLKKAHDDAYTAISNAFLQLPAVVTGLQDLLYKNDYSSTQENASYYINMVLGYDNSATIYKDSSLSSYILARSSFDKNFIDYKATSRYASDTEIEQLLEETYNTTVVISEAVKNSNNFLSFVQDRLVEHHSTVPNLLNTHLSNLASYTGTVNSNLQSVLNTKNAIKNSLDTISSSDRTIKEKTESLAKLQSGSDLIDIKSAQLNVQQRQNALLDAQEKLSDYFVRAPFDGTVTKINIKKFDAISSGTIVTTLITKQTVSEISLNEVDVAKIKIDSKAILTFDAYPDLSMTGKVVEIDNIGTVTQGVVNYTVKINFDTQDDRIKPGMSVSASIITNVKQDILTVPNSAIKTQGSNNYVEVFEIPLPSDQTNQGVVSPIAPKQVPIEIGISNDTATEIISGLKEGDQVVTKTITAATAAKTASTQAPNILGSIGGNRGGAATGGNAARALGR